MYTNQGSSLSFVAVVIIPPVSYHFSGFLIWRIYIHILMRNISIGYITTETQPGTNTPDQELYTVSWFSVLPRTLIFIGGGGESLTSSAVMQSTFYSPSWLGYRRDWVLRTFFKDISPKVNIIAWLEIQLIYCNVTIQYVSLGILHLHKGVRGLIECPIH